MNSINLFCIPYAGGSAKTIYGKWVEKLSPHVHVSCLELAGHGLRMNERFHSSLRAAVEEMLETIRPSITDMPYALYGHSMGSVLAYELAAAARSLGLPQPKTLFLSGRQPPHLAYLTNNVHSLSDEEFIKHIKRIGGTPQQFFESKSLLNIFLPILKSDYRLIEEYVFQEPPVQLDSEIVFFYSDQDFYVEKPKILEWERYTNKSLKVIDFPGGHFFINELWPNICEMINQELLVLPHHSDFVR